MLNFENTIVIARPIEEVFAFLTDFENIPKWNYYVLSVHKQTPGPAQVGDSYHQVRKIDEQDFRLTELTPEHVIALESKPESTPWFTRRFVLQAQDGGTLVQDTWQLDTGKPALLEKLTGGKVKSAVAENLALLKALLEQGQVTLQDGRRICLEPA